MAVVVSRFGRRLRCTSETLRAQVYCRDSESSSVLQRLRGLRCTAETLRATANGSGKL